MSFEDKYEKEIDKLFQLGIGYAHQNDEHKLDVLDASITADVKKILKDRRDMGREKYGDVSFQSSEKNAFATPIKQHFLEELYDAMNYLLHWRWMLMKKGRSTRFNIHFFEESFHSLLELYAQAQEAETINDKP